MTRYITQLIKKKFNVQDMVDYNYLCTELIINIEVCLTKTIFSLMILTACCKHPIAVSLSKKK